jgi:transposase
MALLVPGSGWQQRVAELERKLAQARRENATLCRENAGLREENARLRKQLEEWKRGHRERRKRRSSRPEGRRGAPRKKPGRRHGHPGASRPVPQPDRQVEHPLPARCECGGRVTPTGETESTIVQDIPPVQPENVEHIAPVGCCARCGKRVVARLPGSVQAGQSVAQVQLGPHAQALIVSLRYNQRVAVRGISSILGTWFELPISAGGVCQLLHRLTARSSGSYLEIEEHVRHCGVVGADETGLRQDGVNGWAWLVRTAQASLFRVELSRGSWVIESMLGNGFVGVVCSDFYAAYTHRADWAHGYCGAHLLREAKKIAEVSPEPRTEQFRDQLGDWYARAKAAKEHGSAWARGRARNQLSELIQARPCGEHPDVERLCNRIAACYGGVVMFLVHPEVDADNNATERDIRALAAYRKVTGGTRSAKGSRDLAHWMSVTQTLKKNDLSLSDYMRGLWDAHLTGRPPPSVFAPS